VHYLQIRAQTQLQLPRVIVLDIFVAPVEDRRRRDSDCDRAAEHQQQKLP
jgi:hypothetical protein